MCSTTRSVQHIKWGRQESNLHSFWELDPKSSASANSATPPHHVFNLIRLSHRLAVPAVHGAEGRCDLFLSAAPRCPFRLLLAVPSRCYSRRRIARIRQRENVWWQSVRSVRRESQDTTWRQTTGENDGPGSGCGIPDRVLRAAWSVLQYHGHRWLTRCNRVKQETQYRMVVPMDQKTRKRVFRESTQPLRWRRQ